MSRTNFFRRFFRSEAPQESETQQITGEKREMIEGIIRLIGTNGEGGDGAACRCRLSFA